MSVIEFGEHNLKQRVQQRISVAPVERFYFIPIVWTSQMIIKLDCGNALVWSILSVYQGWLGLCDCLKKNEVKLT